MRCAYGFTRKLRKRSFGPFFRGGGREKRTSRRRLADGRTRRVSD
jgi:hypothetical protein